MAKTLVAWPTARQVPTAGHETPRSSSLKVAFRFGPAVAVQAEPFQFSMRVDPMLFLTPVDPTATHHEVLRQVTAERTGSAAVPPAVGIEVHAAPFHSSLSAAVPLAEPTAIQKFHATHDTPLSWPMPDGVGRLTARPATPIPTLGHRGDNAPAGGTADGHADVSARAGGRRQTIAGRPRTRWWRGELPPGGGQGPRRSRGSHQWRHPGGSQDDERHHHHAPTFQSPTTHPGPPPLHGSVYRPPGRKFSVSAASAQVRGLFPARGRAIRQCADQWAVILSHPADDPLSNRPAGIRR